MDDPHSSPRRYTVPCEQHGQVQPFFDGRNLSARHHENSQFEAANRTVNPLDYDDEQEDEQVVERDLEAMETDHTEIPGDPLIDPAIYAQIVHAASDAATLAVLRVLQSGGPNPPPAPPDLPSSDGNESGTAALQPFTPPPGKKRVPRHNQDKLVDEAMRNFLEGKGVLAKRNYSPKEPNEEFVNAYEERGILGPDPNSPRITLKQTFKGKWNARVVEILTEQFISAVAQGMYKPVEYTWPQMKVDKVRKKCQTKLYRTQHLCRKPRRGPESDKINRTYQRRQETYYRRRRICNLNYSRDPETWGHVKLLLDALGTRGTSDDETDDDSERPNPDPRFKTVRRIDTGFLNPAIAEIWASVESYPSFIQPSRGNRSFRRISKANSIGKNRTPLPGLPINYYNPGWLQTNNSRFLMNVKAEVPLPILVPYDME